MTLRHGDSKENTITLQATLGDSRERFLETVQSLRPRMHRFCARMCGSVLDGEDLVQETLAEAFYQLPTLRDATRLEAWMFRIAHHKCVDFLRRDRRWREDAVSYEEEEHSGPHLADDADLADAPIDLALAALVGELPAKERAAVLLKDVLDYSLSEVADVIDSTIGGVKAALHRGRAKLRSLPPAPTQAPAPATLGASRQALFEAYADCFNRRDWDALRHLVRADARLEIVGKSQGRMADLGATYSGNYTALPGVWKLSSALVDGDTVLVHWRQLHSEWHPHTAIRLWWKSGQVVRIRDYAHVDYVLAGARMEFSADSRCVHVCDE